jgi:hypothetical protein
MMGRKHSRASFLPRKPLIQKTQVVWRMDGAGAHRIAQRLVGFLVDGLGTGGG